MATPFFFMRKIPSFCGNPRIQRRFPFAADDTVVVLRQLRTVF
jgi:hypothetical protein